MDLGSILATLGTLEGFIFIDDDDGKDDDDKDGDQVVMMVTM